MVVFHRSFCELAFPEARHKSLHTVRRSDNDKGQLYNNTFLRDLLDTDILL